MPLSEQEQRLLDEMERSLYHHDADDVATVGPRSRASSTAIVVAVLAAVLGLALLVVGVVVRQPLVGVAGFGALLGAVLLVVSPPRRWTVGRRD